MSTYSRLVASRGSSISLRIGGREKCSMLLTIYPGQKRKYPDLGIQKIG